MYQHAVNLRFSNGLGVGIRWNESFSLLVWVCRNPGGAYLDMTTFERPGSDEDPKNVLSPKQLVDLLFRVGAHGTPSEPPRCATLPGCAEQIEFGFVQDTYRIAFGRSEAEATHLSVDSNPSGLETDDLAVENIAEFLLRASL